MTIQLRERPLCLLICQSTARLIGKSYHQKTDAFMFVGTSVIEKLPEKCDCSAMSAVDQNIQTF